MKIEILNDKISVAAGYNSGFVTAARKLGGKFEKGEWRFDAENESQVRDAAFRHYGDDGIRRYQCDVKVTIAGNYGVVGAPIEFFGRTVARAFGRDSGVRYGDDAVIVSGEFRSGGSAKNWRTVCEDGATVILRGVSRVLVDEWEDTEKVSVEILSVENPVDALLSERAKLRARLTEIDAELQQYER